MSIISTIHRTPRIYVACIEAYNAGHLHGVWIDCAGMDAGAIQAAIDTMLSESPVEGSEEWAIHDNEGFYGVIDNVSDLDLIAELAEFFTTEDELAHVALLWLIKEVGYTIQDALMVWQDVYVYDGTLREYAEEYISDNYGNMGGLASYFDYDAFARDLEISGDIAACELEGFRIVTITNASSF